MAVPELVVVPARPELGAEGPVGFEVRGQADGQWVLPVFSSVAALVRELGCYQPWVCVPWRLAAEAAGRAGLTQMVLDPVAGTFAQRWRAADLTAYSGRQARVDEGFQVAMTDLLQVAAVFRAEGQSFTLQQSLLLYAFLLHLIEGTEEFPRRLRVLRNLITASEDEVRRPNMPALVKDVKEIIVNGDLDSVTRFSSSQVEDERRKIEFLDASPDLADALFRLEDHPILRGTLSAFEYHADSFRQRAEAFEIIFKDRRLWLGLTGALLTFGDYQRQRPGSSAWQFGTSSPDKDTTWRYLLTGTARQSLSSTRTVLGNFLDGLAGADGDVSEYFEAVMNSWLSERENSRTFDWRYYLVKYPSMRTGATGIYYGVDGKLGYSMCMMRTIQRNGYYRDPILLEVWASSEAGDLVQDPWFFGYETNPRWLRLERSGVGMRSVSGGFALQGPEDEALKETFTDVCNQHAAVERTDEAAMLKIPQHEHADGLVDSTDRVVAGAAFLRELVEAGL